MAKRKLELLADAMMPSQTVHKLRRLGYDVLTVQQYQGTSEPEHGLSDETVLEVATTLRRAVVTLNGKDYRRLHYNSRGHQGIIICDETSDLQLRAKEIDDLIKSESPLVGRLLYIPSKEHDEDA